MFIQPSGVPQPDEQVRGSRMDGGFHPPDRHRILGGWLQCFEVSPSHVPKNSQRVWHRHVYTSTYPQYALPIGSCSRLPTRTSQTRVYRQLAV